MKSLLIKNNIYWVGALDPNLRVFDIIMNTPYGTSYNSYAVKGSAKTCLFETVKAEFFPEYLERLKSLNIDVNNIDYIVVNHTEPDHAGSVEKLLKLSPNAKVIGSNLAIKFLKQIVNMEFNYICVNEKDTISLGDKTLKFISAPMLHWPDSMYTYIEEDEMLITCDSFGSHYCLKEIFNDKITNHDEYLESLKHYYDCIISPFKPYVLKAINKIENLKISTICPGHGPVLIDNPQKIVELYKEWSAPTPVIQNKVTICYVSAYGYTKEIAEAISCGIKSAGDFSVNMFDVSNSKLDDILSSINSSRGIMFGSPTILCDMLEPIRNVLTNLNPVVHSNKFAAAFGSYGWSGEAIPRIETRFSELKMNVPLKGLSIQFKPSVHDLNSAKDFGLNFAKALISK